MTSSARPSSARFLKALMLFALVVLVTGPRFNRMDLGLSGLTRSPEVAGVAPYDAANYADCVRWWRGEPVVQPLATPFSRRLLGPAIASLLPAEPMTALNVVNVLAVYLAALAVFAAQRSLGQRDAVAWLVCGLYVVSFPVFYYGAIGYIDPVVLLFHSLFVLGLCWGSAPACVLALVLGCMAKESMLIAVPVFLVASASRESRSIAFRQAVFAVAAVAAVLFAANELLPYEVDRVHPPQVTILIGNLFRERAWASLTLTFGPLGAAFVACLGLTVLRRRLLEHDLAVPLMVGVVATLVAVLLSFWVVVVDGRLLWTAYPYVVAMLGVMLSDTATARPDASR